MKRIFFILLIFISKNIYSQQEIRVQAKGNGNKIIAAQEQRDSSGQKINLNIEGDTNYAKVNQNSNSKISLDTSKLTDKNEPTGFKKILENTNLLIGLLISIPALILAWKRIATIIKKNNRT